MIRLLDGFPDNVIAISGGGRISREDYENVVIPRIEAAARQHRTLRCYYEIGADFAGIDPAALWDDFRVGIEYWRRWERVAAVTDVAWIAQMVNAFRFLMPGQVRVFPNSDKEAARAWIMAD